MKLRQTLLFSLFTSAQAYVATTSEGCFSSVSGFTQIDSDSSSMTSMFCAEKCLAAGYSVVAVTDGINCYCGNVVPSGDSSSSCDITCPAYPAEYCGGSDAYNVYLIGGATTSASVGSSTSSSSSGSGSGSAATASSDSQSSSNTVTTSSSAAASTVTASGSVTTVTASASASASSSSSTSSSSESSNSSSSSSSSSSSASTTASSSVASGKSSSSKKLGSGAIAGIVVGSLAGVAAIAALIIFLVIRRRRDEDDDYYSPQSTPSKFKEANGLSGSYNTSQGFGNHPVPIIDQRLNPEMLGEHRISIASLADARDYSRQILHVTNPDDKR